MFAYAFIIGGLKTAATAILVILGILAMTFIIIFIFSL